MMQKSSIWITSINPPINGGTMWHGTAESTDGQRYTWAASPEHWKAEWAHCFREDPSGFWLQEKAPAAPFCAVQTAILAVAH
jgi:hypothetical protein